MTDPTYSLEKAKAYQQKKEVLGFVHLLLSPVLLILFVMTPLSLWFKQYAVVLSPSFSMQLALYFSFFSVFMLLWDVPLDFYSGFVLEHRFELSNQKFRTWFFDFLKKSVLSFLFSLALIEAFYALIRRFPDKWWLLAWGGFALVAYVLGRIFPVFIVPLFYKYGAVENESLKKRIFDLVARYGLTFKNICSINLSKTTKKANAAFMGMGKTRRVVLSDTLLQNFNEDEIETVVAHELGHCKHHDVLKYLIFSTLTSFFSFWLIFHWGNTSAYALKFDGISDPAAMPVLFLGFYLFHLILMPIQNGLSRMAERKADRFALEAFPKPGVFISCMEKLERQNLAHPDPHPVIEWFFYDHPATRKRIRMAEEWAVQGSRNG